MHNQAGAESFLYNWFVHNRAGAESFLYDCFVHNRAGVESFSHNRFVHNRAGAQSFLHNCFVHNRAGAELCRVQSIRCSIVLVHNRSVPDRSCWIGTVQNRAVLDRYYPDMSRKSTPSSKICFFGLFLNNNIPWRSLFLCFSPCRWTRAL